MRILLDESLPIKLFFSFDTQHEVLTARDMNWLGKKNGELLRLMINNNFDVFVTADRNLVYQQNVGNVAIRIVMLCGSNNRITTYQKLIPKLLDYLLQTDSPKIIEIS